jgi:hypothetical protein
MERFSSLGAILALLVLVVVVVLAVMGDRNPVLGLVALLAIARLT